MVNRIDSKKKRKEKKKRREIPSIILPWSSYPVIDLTLVSLSYTYPARYKIIG